MTHLITDTSGQQQLPSADQFEFGSLFPYDFPAIVSRSLIPVLPLPPNCAAKTNPNLRSRQDGMTCKRCLRQRSDITRCILGSSDLAIG